MRWTTRAIVAFRSLFRRPRIERELDAELQFHLEQQIAENVAAGMSPAAARAAALRSLGSIAHVKEECRDSLGLRFLDELGQDLRCTGRTLIKAPTFTLTAIVTLALGIGANTAIFSVVDGALLHPLPFPNPDRLVAVYGTSTYWDRNGISYPNVLDWQRQNQTFEELAVWRLDTFTLTGRGRAEHLVGVMVSANLFSALQVHAMVGRTFRPDEDRRGVAPQAMIGEGLWVRRFGRDPQIIGQPLTLNGRVYTVIGVVPSILRLDRAGGSSFANDVFLPIGIYDDPLFLMRGSGGNTRVLARLKPGISLTQAQADMNVVAENLANAFPESNRGVGVNVMMLEDDVVGDMRRVLWTLLGAVGFVLLIACANVANLALARSERGSKPDAVRAALSDLDDRLAGIPAAEAASVLVGSILFTSDTTVGFRRADEPRPTMPSEMREAMYSAVGPAYFRTMRSSPSCARALRQRVS